MMRRMVVGGVTAALFLVVLAACGGSSASPSAEPSEAVVTPAATTAPASGEPSAEPAASEVPAVVRLTAQCAGVGIRKGPSPNEGLLVRVSKGATVRVVETVTGEPYEAGSCGQSGDDWIKVDRINGKSVKSLYGVPYGYAAGGFFR
jgi:hypothetical protein